MELLTILYKLLIMQSLLYAGRNVIKTYSSWLGVGNTLAVKPTHASVDSSVLSSGRRFDGVTWHIPYMFVPLLTLSGYMKTAKHCFGSWNVRSMLDTEGPVAVSSQVCTCVCASRFSVNSLVQQKPGASNMGQPWIKGYMHINKSVLSCMVTETNSGEKMIFS